MIERLMTAVHSDSLNTSHSSNYIELYFCYQRSYFDYIVVIAIIIIISIGIIKYVSK